MLLASLFLALGILYTMSGLYAAYVITRMLTNGGYSISRNRGMYAIACFPIVNTLLAALHMAGMLPLDKSN